MDAIKNIKATSILKPPNNMKSLRDINRLLPDERRVIIVGPLQSGSTLLFNLIRLILIETKEDVFSSFWGRLDAKDIENIDKIKNTVYKIHGFNNIVIQKCNFIFLAVRDPRDSASSARLRNPHKNKTLNDLSRRAKINIDYIEQWRPHASYIFKYEIYKNDPIMIIREICQSLKIDPDCIDLKKIHADAENVINDPQCTQIPERDKEFFKTTIMCKENNTTNGKISHYKDTLKPNEIKLLNEKYGIWLKQNGYLIE